MDIKEQINLLVALQEKDTHLDEIRKNAQAIPKAIEEEKAAMENIKSETEEKKKNLQKLQLLKKSKELDLEAKESQIKKHSSELNSIKSNDMYKALIVEIDNCKKDKNSIENEILDVMEGIEKETALIKENEKQLKVKESESAGRIAALQEQQKKIEAEVSGYEDARKQFCSALPAELLSRYEYIRESQGIAVVPMDGENCGGCQIILRPHIINDVCKHQQLVCCDSCSRILYKK
jgi:hypothetical protein